MGTWKQVSPKQLLDNKHRKFLKDLTEEIGESSDIYLTSGGSPASVRYTIRSALEEKVEQSLLTFEEAKQIKDNLFTALGIL